MPYPFDRSCIKHSKIGRTGLLSALILWGVLVSPSLAADDVANPSSFDASIDSIKQRTQSLYNQTQTPAATSYAPAYAPQSQQAPSSLAQTENDVTIRNNVARLYGETLSGKTQPSALAPQTVPTPAVDTLAATAPRASEIRPEDTPVAISTAPQPASDNTAPAAVAAPVAAAAVAAPVAATSVISTAASTPAAALAAMPVGTPAPTPEAIRASIMASQATTSSTSTASSLVTGPVTQTPAVSALPSARNATAQQPPSQPQAQTLHTPNASTTGEVVPPSGIAAAAAKTPGTITQSTFTTSTPQANITIGANGMSDEQSSNFLRELAGTDGVPLNVVDAVAPADIQTPMHLDEAVAFALKNNFEVQAASEKVNGAFWDKMGAYSQYLPNLQTAVDTGPERSNPASINDAEGNRVLDNTHNRKDSSITVTQPLIDLGIISDILSGTDKKRLADSDQRDVGEGIAFDTASTYLSLLQSRISIRLSDNYKGYLDDLAVRMQARVTGGGASTADLDRIRGRATQAEAARIEALGEYQTNLAEFKRLTKLMPAQLVIPVVLAPSIPPTMQEAMEKALKGNPSYISSLKKVDIAADDRNKSFAGLLPKLSAQYSDSYSFNAGGAAEGNPVDGIYPTQRTQTALLVAQWAFGGPSVTGGLSGIAKEREMNLRALDVRARIEQGIQAGYTAINAAHQREGALQKSVEADERVVKSFEEQYQNGGRSLFDMLDAYEQLYNARLNLMRVTIAEAKAAYQVRRQMGELQQSILASGAR